MRASARGLLQLIVISWLPAQRSVNKISLLRIVYIRVAKRCPYIFYPDFTGMTSMTDLDLARTSWGVERRLEFIEFRLFWEGGVNRADIVRAFDVSVPQA